MSRFVTTLLVLSSLPCWSGSQALLNNNSKGDWKFQGVADGSNTGGSLTVRNGGGSVTLKGGTPADAFSAEILKVPAGKEFDLIYDYLASFHVRFMLTDAKGEWAEYAARLGTMDRFASGTRYTLLYSSLAAKSLADSGSAAPGLAAVRSAIQTDKPSPGAIGIAQDAMTLPLTTPSRTAPEPTADLGSLKCRSTYFFNQTDKDLTVSVSFRSVKTRIAGSDTTVPVASRGAMIFCDLQGIELFRRDEKGVRKGQPVLPAHSVTRIIYQPDADGVFDNAFRVMDGGANEWHYLVTTLKPKPIDFDGVAPAWGRDWANGGWYMQRLYEPTSEPVQAGGKTVRLSCTEFAQPGGFDLTFTQK